MIISSLMEGGKGARYLPVPMSPPSFQSRLKGNSWLNSLEDWIIMSLKGWSEYVDCVNNSPVVP